MLLSAGNANVNDQQQQHDHWSYYLQDEQTYDRHYWSLIQASHLVNTVEDALSKTVVDRNKNVRIEYRGGVQQLQKLVRQLQLMDDVRSGIVRTAYKGVVETRPHGGGSNHLLFLTPPLEQLQEAFLL